MKIEIKRVTLPNAWYENKIGQQYEVTGLHNEGFKIMYDYDIEKVFFYINDGSLIKASDCTIQSPESIFSSLFLESILKFFQIENGFKDKKNKLKIEQLLRSSKHILFEEVLLVADWVGDTKFFNNEEERIQFLGKLFKSVSSSSKPLYSVKILLNEANGNYNHAYRELHNIISVSSKTIYNLLPFESLPHRNHSEPLWKNGLSVLELHLIRKAYSHFHVTIFNKFGKIKWSFYNSFNSQKHHFPDDIISSFNDDLSMTVVIWKELTSQEMDEILEEKSQQHKIKEDIARKSIIVVNNRNEEIKEKIIGAIFTLNWRKNERYLKNKELSNESFKTTEELMVSPGNEYIEAEVDTEDYSDVYEYWQNH